MLAHWTQTFMPAAAGFVAQFFFRFPAGRALFGKLMDDSGSVSAIADYMTRRLGPSRAILAVVAAGAMVTYGGVSLFVAFFVSGANGAGAVPSGKRARRLLWRHSRLEPRPSPCRPCRERLRSRERSDAVLWYHPFAAPGLGIIASIIMAAMASGWLSFHERQAKARGEGYGAAEKGSAVSRELASTAREFDPAEISRAGSWGGRPPIGLAILPLVLVVVVNLILTQFVLPEHGFRFPLAARMGPKPPCRLSAGSGRWRLRFWSPASCWLP